MNLEPTLALRAAILAKDTAILSVILNDGAEVDSRDQQGNTPLHLAISWGARECARLLLVNGADCNARNDAGSTPLHLAIWNKDMDAVLMLLERRADPYLRTKSGELPYKLSQRLGADEITTILREHNQTRGRFGRI